MEAISIRKYQMTDSKFAFFLVVLTDRIRNNIASFAKFGVTEQEIEEFEPVEQELMEQLIEVVKTNFDSDGDILDELSDE